MGRNIAFDQAIEERKMLSFSKNFQAADLSSERMRALPYNFITRVSKKDLCDKMVIRAQWGKTWDVKISRNSSFYYIERRGWDQFVSDNALGENEFVTFTHRGKMIFHVNIYEQNGREMLMPRKLLMGRGIKKEEGESSYKNVKKEQEETNESPARFEFKVSKKTTEEGAKLKAREKKAEGSNTFKEKKDTSNNVVTDVPEFKVTIKKSYLDYLLIPKDFEDGALSKESKIVTVRHPNGINSWEVHYLVRENVKKFSGGYRRMAREFPLSVGDECTFKLIKPFEFLLVIS